MPWIEATLRGQRVLARAKADGALVVEGGRVEIRYNPKDGRAYRAAARTSRSRPGGKLLADEACVPVAAGAPARRTRAGGAAGEAASLRGAGGAAQSPARPVRWIAYTDGACSGNPGPAGSGVVLVSPKGKMYEGFEYLGEATNNVAELTAILRAVEWLPPPARRHGRAHRQPVRDWRAAEGLAGQGQSGARRAARSAPSRRAARGSSTCRATRVCRSTSGRTNWRARRSSRRRTAAALVPEGA